MLLLSKFWASHGKKAWSIAAGISVLMTLILGAPQIYYAYTCSERLEYCEKSPFGPPLEAIDSTGINRVRSQLGTAESIAFKQFEPLFGKPRLVVQAGSGEEWLTLGVLPISKRQVETVAEFPNQGKHVLVVQSKGVPESYKFFDFHVFDTSEKLQYSFLQMSCALTGDAPILLKNFRWNDKNSLPTDNDSSVMGTLSFDLMSDCDSINFNGLHYLDFGGLYKENGRIEISFSNDFVASEFGTREYRQQEENIEKSTTAAQKEIEKCAEAVTRQGNVSGFQKICEVRYNRTIRTERDNGMATWYTLVGFDDAGKKFKRDWICAFTGREETYLSSPEFAVAICPTRIYRWDDSLRMSLSDGMNYQINILKVDGTVSRTDLAAETDDFRVTGVTPIPEGGFEFDLYLNGDELNVGSQKFNIGTESNSDLHVRGGQLQGRFKVMLSATGAVNSLEPLNSGQ